MFTSTAKHILSRSFIADKYEADFYQREYVWEQKQIDDLIPDLTNELLKNWRVGDETSAVKQYSPYFMGEILWNQGRLGCIFVA